MATIRNKVEKLVTIETYGPIAELGGIAGPVVHPCKVDLETIIRMVNTRKKVFEVNPANPSEKVRLTLSNVRTVNFAPVAPKTTTKTTNTTKTTETTKPADTKTTTTENKSTNDFTKK